MGLMRGHKICFMDGLISLNYLCYPFLSGALNTKRILHEMSISYEMTISVRFWLSFDPLQWDFNTFENVIWFTETVIIANLLTLNQIKGNN